MSLIKYQPLIIIGAARSGTNILRDCLVGLDGFGTWPCDEINYIWRHGNREYPHDEFPTELATEVVRKYLKKQFDKQASSLGCNYLVEKTTANSLRLQFVQQCFPDAKYIVIYRNGLDSVYSAMARWQAPLDVGYIMRKAKYVPATDIPFYGFRYLANRVSKLLNKDRILAEWGPKPAARLGVDLIERAATQWSECVRSTKDSIELIPDLNVMEIHYEQFVKDPKNVIRDTLAELCIDVSEDSLDAIENKVHAKSINKGKGGLSDQQLEVIKTIITPQLLRLGYEID